MISLLQPNPVVARLVLSERQGSNDCVFFWWRNLNQARIKISASASGIVTWHCGRWTDVVTDLAPKLESSWTFCVCEHSKQITKYTNKHKSNNRTHIQTPVVSPCIQTCNRWPTAQSNMTPSGILLKRLSTKYDPPPFSPKTGNFRKINPRQFQYPCALLSDMCKHDNNVLRNPNMISLGHNYN